MHGKQIRVLCLQPGEPEDELEGQLLVVDLANAEDPTANEYEALSYCWGDLSKTKEVSISGRRWNITINLFNAIYHLRDRSKPLYLWIDQLCINQFDGPERTAHVRMMLDIFASARQVYTWIGKSKEYSAIGFEVLGDLADIEREPGYPTWQALLPDDTSLGLRDVMERDWWTRSWTVQEVAVARKVTMVCGNHQISWPSKIRRVYYFSRAIKTAVVSPKWKDLGLEYDFFDPLLQVLKLQLESGPDKAVWASKKPKPDPLDLMYNLREREATDPRDRLFALFRLRPFAGGRQLIADYDRSVGEVYKEFEDLTRKNNPFEDSDSDPAAVEEDDQGSTAGRVASHNARGTASGPSQKFTGFSEGTPSTGFVVFMMIGLVQARDRLTKMLGPSSQALAASRTGNVPEMHTQIIVEYIREISRQSIEAALANDLQTAAHSLSRAGEHLLRFLSDDPGLRADDQVDET